MIYYTYVEGIQWEQQSFYNAIKNIFYIDSGPLGLFFWWAQGTIG